MDNQSEDTKNDQFVYLIKPNKILSHYFKLTLSFKARFITISLIIQFTSVFKK